MPRSRRGTVEQPALRSPMPPETTAFLRTEKTTGAPPFFPAPEKPTGARPASRPVSARPNPMRHRGPGFPRPPPQPGENRRPDWPPPARQPEGNRPVGLARWRLFRGRAGSCPPPPQRCARRPAWGPPGPTAESQTGLRPPVGPGKSRRASASGPPGPPAGFYWQRRRGPLGPPPNPGPGALGWVSGVGPPGKGQGPRLPFSALPCWRIPGRGNRWARWPPGPSWGSSLRRPGRQRAQPDSGRSRGPHLPWPARGPRGRGEGAGQFLRPRAGRWAGPGRGFRGRAQGPAPGKRPPEFPVRFPSFTPCPEQPRTGAGLPRPSRAHGAGRLCGRVGPRGEP